MSAENETIRATQPGDLLRMAVDIVAAYVSNNSVAPTQVPEVLSTVYKSLSDINTGNGETRSDSLKPAVSVRKSITPDYIICLEDGKRLKMLKRHLRAAYGLTPELYRAKWGLPPDYPMVAPNYAAQRSVFAKQIGLGRKKGQKVGSRRAKRAAA